MSTEPIDSTPLAEPLFYDPDLAPAGDVTLAGAEAHHVSVQRLRAGDAIALFDGRGSVAHGRIAGFERGAVRVTVERRSRHAPPRPAIDLYTAVPKGDRQAVLLDMGTQLGVRRFVPVQWQRSVVAPAARATERWRRICIEACKQSRQPYLPEVRAPVPLAQALDAARASGARLIAAHPDPQARAAAALEVAAGDRLAVFIGPEGGIAGEEIARLRAHRIEVVQLGRAVLRVEAAAVALVATLRALANRAAAPDPGGV